MILLLQKLLPDTAKLAFKFILKVRNTDIPLTLGFRQSLNIKLTFFIFFYILFL